MASSTDGNAGEAPLHHEVREADCSLSELLLVAMSSGRPRVVVKDAFRMENFGTTSSLLRFAPPPPPGFNLEPEAVGDLAGPAYPQEAVRIEPRNEDRFQNRSEHPGRCHWCPARCPSWRSYVAHLREHHAVTGHVCDECAEVLVSVEEREAHECVHSRKAARKLCLRVRLWCPLCPASFVRRCTLKAHRNVYHEGHGLAWVAVTKSKQSAVLLPKVVPRFGGPLHTQGISNQTNITSSCSVSASDALRTSNTVGISDQFPNSSAGLPPMIVRLPRVFPAFEGPTEPTPTVNDPAASTNSASAEANSTSAETSSTNSTTTASSETADLSTVRKRLRHLMQLPPSNLYQLLQESSPLAGLHLPAPPPILIKATSKSAKTSRSAAASAGTTKQPTVRKRLRQLMKLRPANLHRLLRKSSPLAGLHLPPPPPIF